MLSFSINSIIAHFVWTILPFLRMCVNEIMGSIASIIDRDMEFLVWTTLSFWRKWNSGLLDWNHVVFLEKVKTWTTGFELLSFCKKLTVKDNMCQLNHEDAVIRSSHQRGSIIKGVPRNFTKSTGNTCARVSFLIKYTKLY